jgi:dTDP-4-dehydrorhamnose reductase
MAKLAAERPELNVVNDQRGRPTSAVQLARRALDLAGTGLRGMHHATDAGECTWHGFTTEIARLTGAAAAINPCTSDQFPRPAKRPAYSVLDLTTTDNAIGPANPWQHELAAALRTAGLLATKETA